MVPEYLGVLTSVNLATDDHFGFTDSSLDYGAILSVVVDHHVLTPFDKVAWSGVPLIWQQGKGLELIS